MRIGHRGNQCGCEQRADTGNVIEAFADFAHPVPGEDAAIPIKDLMLHHLKLIAQRQQTILCGGRHTVITVILDNVEQPLQPIAADARDNAELGQVGAQGISSKLPYRLTDLAFPQENFDQRDTVFMMTNLSRYFGYIISTNAGLRHRVKKFDDSAEDELRGERFTAVFINAILGFEED